MPVTENHGKGFFLISRSIYESAIWNKPSGHLKVWIFLLGRANHAPAKYRGFYVERGQFFGTYREIRESLSYYRGWAKEGVNESRVKHIMNGLKKMGMITVKKEPAGVLITVLNYDLYQSAGNYERTAINAVNDPKSEPPTNQKKLTNNKKEKEKKNKETSSECAYEGKKREEILTLLTKSGWKNPEFILHKFERGYEPRAVRKVMNAWKMGTVHSLKDMQEYAEKCQKDIERRGRELALSLSDDDKQN